MSNIRHLLEIYRKSPAVVQLTKALEQANARVQLSGLTGAQGSFVIAAAAEITAKGAHSTHLYIANSKEEAAYLQNDLAGILAEETILFFPDSFKRPSFFEDLNQTQVLQRSETVNKLAPPSPPMRGGAVNSSVNSTDNASGKAKEQSKDRYTELSTAPPPMRGGAVNSSVNSTDNASGKAKEQSKDRYTELSTAPPPMRGGAVNSSVNSTDNASGKAKEQSKDRYTELSTAPPLMGGLGGASTIIVTYPEALFEKVVSPEVLQKSRIEVIKGEKLDVDFMMEVLVEYGFERTDFVYEPGQFSIRGGIIDLFSYGNEWPYRIELFDDEVETIRVFEPLTQLSKQNISRVNIVPNLNTRFRQDQKVSMFRVLPEGTVLWIKDFQFLLDRLQYCFDKAETFAAKLTALDTAELREIFRDRAFLYPADVLEDVVAHPIVFLEGRMEVLKRDFPGMF